MALPLLALAAALAATPAAAAERPEREQEIVINADHSTIDDASKLVTLTGNVIVTRATMRITAAKVTLKEDAKGSRGYVATGSPVTFRQKKDKVDEWVEGVADRAEFDDGTEMLRLFGNARVKSPQGEMTGDFVSYDMRREVAEVAGAPPGQKAPANSRVKVIIIPKKAQSSGEEAKAPSLELKTDAGKR